MYVAVFNYCSMLQSPAKRGGAGGGAGGRPSGGRAVAGRARGGPASRGARGRGGRGRGAGSSESPGTKRPSKGAAVSSKTLTYNELKSKVFLFFGNWQLMQCAHVLLLLCFQWKSHKRHYRTLWKRNCYESYIKINNKINLSSKINNKLLVY